ncbi:MAG: AsmA family protein [Bacteroidota bacterium]
MKILYKFLKIAGLIILSVILFMIITVVVAKIFEDELASFTIKKLESEINAPMSIGKVSLIPLFSFPRLSAEINKLYIGDPQSQNSDTLFFINSLKVGLDSWDLIFGVYTIDEVEISGLDFEYTIDKSGKSNIDFLINNFVDTNTENTDDTVATHIDISAEKIKLENIHISYYDSLTNIGSQVTIPEITIKATTKNNNYKGKTNGSIVLSHCLFKDTKVDQMESCTVTFDLEYENDEAIINKLSISSEGIVLGMEGVFSNSDGLGLNANIEAIGIDFNILSKYIPNQYINLFEDTNLTQMESISLDLNLDYKDKNIDIKKLLLHSEGLDLGVNGTINLSDTLSIYANLETLKLDFDILKKYIPEHYFKEYGIIDMGGIMDISAKIAGKYADSTLLPRVDANANFRNIRIQTTDYPQINAINLTSTITTGEKSDLSEASVHITNAEIISPGSYVHIEGTIVGIENPKYNVSSKLDLNLVEFKNLIPDSLVKYLEGNITALINTSGTLPEKVTDNFVDYLLDNTTVSLYVNEVSALITDSLQIESFSTYINYSPQESGVKRIQMDNLNVESEALNINLQNSSLSAIVSGKVADPLHMSAKLNSFNIQNGNNRITGNGEINNFETPEFNINTTIVLKLEELLPFAPDLLIKNMSGTVEAHIKLQGKINPDSLDSQLLPILFENSSFDLTFNNITLAFPDSIMNIDSIYAHIGLKNDILTINNFSANYNGLKFEMDSTKVHNLYKAVILNQKKEFYVNTHVKFGDIFFDDFKHLMAYGEIKTDIDTMASSQKFSIDTIVKVKPQNWTYLIHGSVSVNSIIIDSIALDDFNINRLHINDMSSLFKFSDSSYILDQFKFNVFEGEMNNSLHYKVRDDGTQSVSTHNIIHNMNIRTMLRDMDNFGMDSLITFENISGLFSTDLNTFVPIDDSIKLDKMMVSGEITLEKGGVYNFPPAQQISKFTSIKELNNIQFKTLRSNIFMFKNKLYIPRTNVVSNALDIAAFGMQSLDGDSDYHMEIHLSNILFGKSKRRNKKQNKGGEEIDEKSLKKSSHKVRYIVTEGKPKVGRDTKDKRDAMMNKIRVQKKMLDFIFFPKNIHYNTESE